MIRYAEILLSYVEALNNLTGSHTVTFSDESTGTYTRDMNEMAKYFNMVRYRAGLPGLTTDELSSADKMFDIIVRERMLSSFTRTDVFMMSVVGVFIWIRKKNRL